MEKIITVKQKLIGTLVLIGCTLAWGSSFLVIKDAINGIPPFFLLGARFLIGAAAIGALCGKRLRLLNKSIIICGVIAGLMYTTGMLLQTSGLKYTTPGKSAFLTASYCVMMPFMEWIGFKNAPSGKNLIAAVMGLAGIGFVALTSKFQIALGDTLSIAGSFFFALQILFMAIFLKKHDMMLLCFVQILSGGILMTAISLFTERIPPLGPSVIPIFLFLGVICSGAATVGQSFSQRRLSPTVVTIIMGFEAVFAAIFSAIFYHEAFTLRCLVGFALIFAAVIIGELPDKKSKITAKN